VIWRIVARLDLHRHAVGAGKSYAIAGAIMEQKRLALSPSDAGVPGHCLAQVCANSCDFIRPAASWSPAKRIS